MNNFFVRVVVPHILLTVYSFTFLFLIFLFSFYNQKNIPVLLHCSFHQIPPIQSTPSFLPSFPPPTNKIIRADFFSLLPSDLFSHNFTDIIFHTNEILIRYIYKKKKRSNSRALAR